MAGADFSGCIRALAEGLLSAAETVHFLTERRDRKRWRISSPHHHDSSQLLHLRMLHRSLVDAATQCQNTSTDRRSRFGPAFDAGDPTSLAALKDILLDLHANVLSPLQASRNAAAAEDVSCDLSSVHEAVIMQKTDALAAIDDLCRRIMHAVPKKDPAAVQLPAPTPTPALAAMEDLAETSGSRFPLRLTVPQPSLPDYDGIGTEISQPTALTMMTTMFSGEGEHDSAPSLSLSRSSSIQHTPLSMLPAHEQKLRERSSDSSDDVSYPEYFPRQARE